MLAIAVDLLTGRYGATAYNRRDQSEWPPHPGRLYSALVAAWADADEPDDAEHEALQWLETQGAPQLTCSSTTEVAYRQAMTHYVPGNDPTVLRSSLDDKHEAVIAATATLADVQARRKPPTRAENAVRKATTQYRAALTKAAAASEGESPSVMAKAMQILPDNRNRQGRTFPSVTPADPRVWFCWPQANPDPAMRATLDALTSKVSRLGHSATYVSCHVADDPPAPTLVPGTGRTVLRIPGKGLLKALEREHLRRGGRLDRDRALPKLEMRYGPPRGTVAKPVTGVLSGDWIMLKLDADPRANRPTQVSTTRSLDLARAVRSALLAHAEDAAAEFITGRWSHGAARPHLAVVPFASVGHRWADGTVRGVALMFPRDADDTQRAAVEHAVAGWSQAGLNVTLRGSASDVTLSFAESRLVPRDGDDVPTEDSYALRRGRWCAPAQTWISVTPVVLDQFVKGLHHNRENVRVTSDAKVRDIIARSCVHYGLPRPENVIISPIGMTAGVPSAAGPRQRPGAKSFPPYVAAGSGQRRQSVHAVVTFAEKVAGPVILGAGRYSGYGLFVPYRDPQRRGGGTDA